MEAEALAGAGAGAVGAVAGERSRRLSELRGGPAGIVLRVLRGEAGRGGGFHDPQFRGARARRTREPGRALPRSLWRLLFQPGELTVEWLRGRRKLYVRPLQLFLLANLIYFVVQPLTGYNEYNTTLSSQMDRQFYSESLGIAETVRAEAARRGQSMEVFEAAYDAKSEMLAKTLVLVMVPLFALAIAIANGR